MGLTIRRLCLCAGAFSLAFAFLPTAALAGASTTVFTTLVVQPKDQPADNKPIVVSADPKKTPTGEMKLDAYLASIPRQASLKSCALRLVTASGLAASNDNGVHLQLFSESAKPIGDRTVDPGTAPKSPIVVQTSGLCRSLETARKTGIASLRLQTTTGNGKISFFGRVPGEASLDAPRLVVTYDLPDSRPGLADWSQARGDAQHSGRSPWRMYNPSGGYTPGAFAVRSLGDAKFLEVSPPVLLYGQKVLAVSANGATVQMTDSGGTAVKSIDLPVKPKFIAVSQQGWLYVIGENKLVVQNIESQQRITIAIKEGETVLVPPTIGADGSVYVVTNRYVYAYPAPPAPAGQAYSPLWSYLTGAEGNDDVSAVALSEDGRTAYIVDKKTATMIAFDAATGAEKWRQAGLDISRSANQPMPVPVVAGGAVYVTNSAPTGGALYIVADNTNSAALETLSGQGMTAPVVGPDNTVYYVGDGILQRPSWDSAAKKFKEVAVGGAGCDKLAGFDLLRADQSGDIYAVDTIGGRFVYVTADDKSVPAGACTPIKVDLGSGLAIAADGTAYSYTRTARLQALIPAAGSFGNGDVLPLTNEILKLTPDEKALVENNDMTFRAGKTIETGKLILPANTNINIVAGESIKFGPGLRIVEGARLHARVGF